MVAFERWEEQMSPSTAGIHHVTAIAGDPQRNLDFYEGVLGLRLVKKTVNFDDPGTYHLYYGDAGAEVQVRWQRTGHGPAPEAVEGAKRWLSQAVRGATAGMG